MQWPPLKKFAAQPYKIKTRKEIEQDIEALFQQALTLHEQGQLGLAQDTCEKVLLKNPSHVDAFHLLGVIAGQLGNPALAVDLISKSLQLNARNAVAHNNLGIAQQELEQFEDSIASFNRAIEIRPDFPDVYFNRGISFQKMQFFEEALNSFERAIEVQPDSAKAHSNLGITLRELKRLDASVASYDRAISLDPLFTEAYFNRGVSLQELKKHDEAIGSYALALKLDPKYLEAYTNTGLSLYALRRYEEAITWQDRAIALRFDFFEAHTNRGIALQELQRLDEAVMSFDRAIAIQPNYAEAHWNKSLALLLGGNFEQGWPLFEWRWQTKELGKFKRDISQPLWLGKEDIAGKTVLLHSEQGLGDSIQFFRFAQCIQARGARVLLGVQQPLLELFRETGWVDALVEKDKPMPHFDFHCPFMSLPLAFNTQLDNIPSPKAYLFANAGKVAEWASRLGPKTKTRVGLAWSGNPDHANDHNRSLALEELLNSLPTGFEYVSLHKEVLEKDKPILENYQVQHYGAMLHDFTETAALCENMDLVITVDTSIAHLAGAMGKVTWVLLPYAPDWRWMLGRSNSPWYPSVRLFRQDKLRQWSVVLKNIALELS